MKGSLHSARKGALPMPSSRRGPLPSVIQARRKLQTQQPLASPTAQPGSFSSITSHQQQQQRRSDLPKVAAQAAVTVDKLQHPDFSAKVYFDASEPLHEFIGPIQVRDLPGRALSHGLLFRKD